MRLEMRKLLEKLGLDWTEDDLACNLRPYALGEFLGSGGAAFVFEGSVESPHRPVVLKFPRVPEPEEVFQISWEACIDALDHEGAILTTCRDVDGVVQLYADRREASLPHLVLERLGTSLDERVGESGEHPLELREAVALVRDLASTAAHMHSRGALHGDITPRNVLLRSSSRWVLIDPAPPTLMTEDFATQGVRGEQRDVLGACPSNRQIPGFGGRQRGRCGHEDLPPVPTRPTAAAAAVHRGVVARRTLVPVRP